MASFGFQGVMDFSIPLSLYIITCTYELDRASSWSSTASIDSENAGGSLMAAYVLEKP